MITVYTESYISAKHTANLIDKDYISANGYFVTLGGSCTVIWGYSNAEQFHNALVCRTNQIKTLNNIFSNSRVIVKSTGYNISATHILYFLCSVYCKPVVSIEDEKNISEQLKDLNALYDNSDIVLELRKDDDLYFTLIKTNVLLHLFTLKGVVDREIEISNFVKKTYWHTKAEFYSPLDREKAYYGDLKFETQEAAKEVQYATYKKPAVITELIAEANLKRPPGLLDFDAFQKEANSKLGFTAKQSFDILSRLHNKALCSEPNTDCSFLPFNTLTSVYYTVKKIVVNENICELLDITNGISHFLSEIDENDAHAIIPYYSDEIKTLNNEELGVYYLLCDSIVRIFLPPALLYKDKLITNVEGYEFKTSGSFIKEEGWLCIKNNSRETMLPPVSEGLTVRNANVSVYQTETKPPSRYNNATLVSYFNLISCEPYPIGINTNVLYKAKQKAEFIERLIDEGYLYRKKKTIYPTDKAMALVLNFDFSAFKLFSNDYASNISDNEFRTYLFSHKLKYCNSIEDIEKTSISLSTKVGKCPLCLQDVITDKHGWHCKGYTDNSCSFKLDRKLCGKLLNTYYVKRLLNAEQVNIKGFVSKNNKEFNAGIQLVDGMIEFVF